MTKNLFIFGAGFSASSVIERARDDFHHICGTSRSTNKIEQLRHRGIEAEIFQGTMTDEIEAQLRETSHLLISIAPGENDPVLSIMPDLLEKAPRLQWIGYLSTVGVYGDHDGAWVDEETVAKPVSERSKQRVEAEQGWEVAAAQASCPLAIFRLSGIYGPGRNWFVNVEKGKSRRLVKEGQVFNRIHRDDIGAAVALAMGRNINGIFNITDDEPAPPQDVVLYAHELMGREPPPELDFETADITPMARSFYGENKRVNNAKSKKILGLEYEWPNYRIALERMWSEGSWR